MVGSAAVPGAPGPRLPPVTLADACGPTQREGFETAASGSSLGSVSSN